MLQKVMSQFSLEIFCFTVPKTSVGESIAVALTCGSKKVYG